MPTLTIDGKTYEAEAGTSVLDAATANNIWIPTLCHSPALSSYGACRLCLVESIRKGRRKVTTSCTLPATEGLEIVTTSERIQRLRRLVMELILASCPGAEAVVAMARRLGVTGDRLPADSGSDCLRCGLCVRACEEMSTAQAISFSGRGTHREVGTPFGESAPECVLCGACVSVCPTGSRLLDLARLSGRTPRTLLSEFDARLRDRAAVDRPFPQALPNVPAIDPDACLHLNKGGCKACEKACAAGAVRFDDQDREEVVDVGAVVVASGFKEFDAARKPVLGYARSANVLSSMEFERVLSASGPFGGHVVRPSDGAPVRRMAFVQCVGSRDRSCGRRYCSSVCCMYAVKQAVIAREHAKGVEPTIFYMDIRAHGKAFDQYVRRAETEYGVTFKRSRVYSLDRAADGQVVVCYEAEDGTFAREAFDMGILSVGLEPGADVEELARALECELNEHGFFATNPLAPLDATRPGIFVCGAAGGPKDIPGTVTEASAAAARVGMLLGSARGTLTESRTYPPERDVSFEGPRIGVFVCRCGVNIGSVVDVPAVSAYAGSLPNVVWAEENLYTCSQDSQERMKACIEEHGLNRVVVASCSPRTHEPLFQETIRDAGLNPDLFEMANIRDQCSWVHMNSREAATDKARDLVRMAVAKVRYAEPLRRVLLDVNHNALVVGGGLAGMTAAVSLAEQGFNVVLVEKTNRLGGHLLRVDRDLHGHAMAEQAAALASRVAAHRRIEVFWNARVVDVKGFLGNYESTLERKTGKRVRRTAVTHGVAILAVGGAESVPLEYGYKGSRKVLTQLDLEQRLARGRIKTARRVVMIQCVGSREEGHMYCSRLCCSQAVKNAVRIKRAQPSTEVFILYRDMRTHGFRETAYEEARELGVQFLRFDAEHKPEVLRRGESLEVRVRDRLVDGNISIPADLVVLAARIDPNPDNSELAKLFKVPLDEDRFFLEAHAKLRPVDFATDGVFVCGSAHYPRDAEETVAQALATAGRAATILSRARIEGEGRVAGVREERCSGCGACVTVCAYGAIEVDPATHVARVNEGVCKGCGACAATCRAAAVDVRGFRDQQILDVLSGVMEEQV